MRTMAAMHVHPLSILAAINGPEWLFGNPWPVAAVLVCAFALLRLVGRKWAKKPLLHASWGCLVLLAAVLVASRFVETTNRKLMRQTRDLAAACVGPDLKKFDALAAADVAVTIQDGANPEKSTPMMPATSVRQRLSQEGVRSVTCSGVEVVPGPPGQVVVSVSAKVTSAHAAGEDGMTTWQVYWQPTPAGWRAVEIRLVNMPGGASMLKGLFGGH